MSIEAKPLEQRIFNGARAREVLENEAYQQAFADLKSEIKDTWEHSPSRDSEGREKLWLMLSLANKLETMLKTALDTGKLAERDLEFLRNKQTMADKARGYLGLT
jgi:hypothetical protein